MTQSTATKLTATDRLLFFGDSITQFGGDHESGYVNVVKAKLEQIVPGLKVLEAGICGNTVLDLKDRLKQDVLALKPSVVVIYIGTNDVWGQSEHGGVAPQLFRTELSGLIDEIQKAGANVLLCTPAVIGEAKKNQLDQLLDQYGTIIKEIGSERHLPVIDLRHAFKQYLATHNTLDAELGFLTNDGVHLTDAGDALVADEILKVLST